MEVNSEEKNQVEKKSNVEDIPKSKETEVQSKKSVSIVKKTKKSQKEEIPRGLPKSGRPWKTPKKRFATIKKTLNRESFEKKMELRNQLRHIKEVSREIIEQKKQEKIEKHQRRLENIERRKANERKAEVVQVIKNSAKLKRMKKKQMRMIEKRDLSQVKVV